MKRGTRGMGRVFRRGQIFWISYSHNGTKHRESSGSTKRPVAVALLKRRFEELGKGRPAREAEKVLLTDLRALIEADYRLNALRSGKRLAQSWAHLGGVLRRAGDGHQHHGATPRFLCDEQDR